MTYLKVEIGQPLLGLSRDKYNLLANEVDVVVYNSWRLDFGLAIQSFSPFLRAALDLVDLSARSKRNMRIVFISSVSSVAAMAQTTTAPEAPVEDPLTSVNNGYGQSKLAAERIVTAAAGRPGVPVSVVRICQIGGPTDGGQWPDQPWISALLRTSKALKYLPNHVTSVDWEPVDIVSSMLRDFILHPSTGSGPEPVGGMIDVHDTIPLKEWTKKLKNITDPIAEDIARMPALKLLGYNDMLGDGAEHLDFATDSAMQNREVAMPTIDRMMLEKWLHSWVL
ncbi:male sterility protein-domain-containing protein [Jackrogersella minutella]|nr:male sterility protein-domain-containing protein [Jackrogersella minutella]